MTLKIDVCSDLHVDYHARQAEYEVRERGGLYEKPKSHIDWASLKNEGSEVLIIAGDISDNYDDCVSVLRDASEHYPQVIFVDGNHDHYDGGFKVTRSVQEISERLLDEKIYNVTHLNGMASTNFLVGDVQFVGGNGWYDWACYCDRGISRDDAMAAWQAMALDSMRLVFGSIKSPAALASFQSTTLAEGVSSAQTHVGTRKIVVVTHTSPRADLMEYKEGDDIWNLLTPSYVNSGMSEVLRADVNSKIALWVYGHTHNRKITEIDGITYVNNARGLPREHRDEWKLLQFEI